MSTTASAPAGKANATAAPEILWAQRSSEDEAEKNVVMITINVPNLPPVPATKLDLTEKGFTFHAKVGDKTKGVEDKEYSFEMELFDEIDPKESKVSQNSKSMYLILRKKQVQSEFWPRLSKEKVRLHNVKTDFDKWVDEDEQDGAEDPSAGMDPSLAGMGGGMGGMGGMPGMPGMEGMMGGMPGMGGGAGGQMDIQQMLAQMQGGAGAGGMPNFDQFAGGDEDDSDGDDEEEAASIKPADADLVGEVDEISSEGVTKAKDVESVD